MADQIRVEGLRELRRELRRLPGELNKRMGDINKDAAEPVRERATQLVPRRTGRLAGSIRSFKAQARAQVGAGRKSIPYAGPIHFGWAKRNIRPQPFLYDALDQRREQVADRWAKSMDELLDEAWRRLP